MKRKIPKKLTRTLNTAIIGFLLSAAAYFHQERAAPSIPSSEHPPELYANQLGDNLERLYTSAIDNANESVVMIIYALTDHQVINALKAAQKRGVSVKVISDAKASPYLDEKLGGNIPTIRRFGIGLMHLKILIVDHQQVLIGSANMTGESLKMHGNLVMGCTDPILAAMLESKAATMKAEGFGTPMTYKIFNLGGETAEMWFLPDNKQATNRIKQLLQSARKTMRVAMFTWTRKDFAQEVIAAHKRGVDTEVVIDNAAGKGAGAQVVSQLKAAGVKVRLSPPGPLLHHKFLYIDGTILANGSANWTKAAFNDNDDCFVVLSGLNERQRTKMDNLWKTIWQDSLIPR